MQKFFFQFSIFRPKKFCAVVTVSVGHKCDPTSKLCLGGFICTKSDPEEQLQQVGQRLQQVGQRLGPNGQQLQQFGPRLGQRLPQLQQFGRGIPQFPVESDNGEVVQYILSFIHFKVSCWCFVLLFTLWSSIRYLQSTLDF